MNKFRMVYNGKDLKYPNLRIAILLIVYFSIGYIIGYLDGMVI